MKKFVIGLTIFVIIAFIATVASLSTFSQYDYRTKSASGARIIMKSIETEAKHQGYTSVYEMLRDPGNKELVSKYLEARELYFTNLSPWTGIKEKIEDNSVGEMVILRNDGSISINYEVAIIDVKEFLNAKSDPRLSQTNTYVAVTCWHVVSGERGRNETGSLVNTVLLAEQDPGGYAKDIAILSEQNGTTYIFPVIAEGYDPKNDLSIIVFQKPNDSDAKIIPLKIGNSNELHVGRELAVLGSPLGDNNRWTFGYLGDVELIDYPNFPYMRALGHDAFSYYGNSGGPVFAVDYGKPGPEYEYSLIGITEFLRGMPVFFGPTIPISSFAIPSSRLTERLPLMLNQAGNKPKTAKAPFTLFYAEIIIENPGYYYE